MEARQQQELHFHEYPRAQALQGPPTPARNLFMPATPQPEFRRPPAVRPASGPGPKSFPLALRASGRSAPISRR